MGCHLSLVCASVMFGCRWWGRRPAAGGTELAARSRLIPTLLPQLYDRKLNGIPKIDRADELVWSIHHANHALDEFVAITKAAGFAAFTVWCIV